MRRSVVADVVNIVYTFVDAQGPIEKVNPTFEITNRSKELLTVALGPELHMYEYVLSDFWDSVAPVLRRTEREGKRCYTFHNLCHVPAGLPSSGFTQPSLQSGIMRNVTRIWKPF